MSPSPNLARAQQLLSQSRGKDAEQYARLAIADDAEDPLGYLALSWALRQQRRFGDAVDPAREALARAPDSSACHYNLGSIRFALEQWQSAEESLRAALQLDPEDADSYGLLAYLAARDARWEDMLALAENGLRCDGDNVTCANARAHALSKLKRADQAVDTLEHALRRDPENARTHCQLAHVMLERGEYDAAATRYCEALRLDPDLEDAKEGLVEALKGKHWLYSIFLKYIVFMSRLEPRSRWGILIGGFFAQRIVSNMLAHAGHLGAAAAVRVAYGAVVFFSWTASSLFNLLLLVHPLGRHALSPRQKAVSAGVAGALLLALANLAAYFWLEFDAALLSAFAFLVSTLPISSLENVSSSKRMRVALGIAGLQAAAALASSASYLAGYDDASGAFALAAILIAVAYSWLAGFVAR